MTPITLHPLDLLPSTMARSLGRNLAVGAVAILAFSSGIGWLMLCAIAPLLYAMAGLFWYPIMEWRLQRTTVVIGHDAIACNGHPFAYRDVLALSYRRQGTYGRQLRLKGRQRAHAIALHHYDLPAPLNDELLLTLLARRVLEANPKALIDIRY
ncbi:hypothetical protein [Phytopseudomonas daroniae]|uniref:hypothetical protein n=1 Tax=Phytopseudomonas daroniae TaxID=2487519 RepID=UPI0010383DDB|nr:hypothetical protein [Pseudomonas daroniae]